MVAMVLSITLRILDGLKYQPEHADLMISAINLLALFIVTYSILSGVQNNIQRTDKAPIQHNREYLYKRVKFISDIAILTLVICMVIYLIAFRSPKRDDIVSIVALFLSLCDSSLADSISVKILELFGH